MFPASSASTSASSKLRRGPMKLSLEARGKGRGKETPQGRVTRAQRARARGRIVELYGAPQEAPTKGGWQGCRRGACTMYAQVCLPVQRPCRPYRPCSDTADRAWLQACKRHEQGRRVRAAGLRAHGWSAHGVRTQPPPADGIQPWVGAAVGTVGKAVRLGLGGACTVLRSRGRGREAARSSMPQG
jgi:hypothetical protein